MSKSRTLAIEEFHDETGPPSRARFYVIGVLLLIAAPLVFEGGLLCLSSWKQYAGINQTAETPILTAITDQAGTLTEAIHNGLMPWINTASANSAVVLPAAAVVMTISMLMLRR